MNVQSEELEPLAETPDPYGAYPRLSEQQIDTLSAHGERRPIRPGEVLYREGDRCQSFFVILDGKVSVVEDYGASDERVIGVHGRGRFLGELSLVTGESVFVTAVAREAGEVLAVPVSELRQLIARDSVLGDLVLRAFFLRRSILIGLGAGFRIIGSRYSPDTRRLRDFAARNRLPHRWIEVEEDPDAEGLLRELGVKPEETPVVIWRGEHVLRNPSNAELAQVIGLSNWTSHEAAADLIVVGAGPAGLAASVYGASEGLATVTIDSVATGGQAATSSRIENYLGFPAGISGSELAERATIQAEKFGASITVPARATGLEQRDGDWVVQLDDSGELVGRTVVLATGAHYCRLPVPRLEQFEGTSVYYAATEMEAPFCVGAPVVVVGGGNSAGQATLFLSKHAASVTLVVREAELGEHMSRYLVDSIERAPGVSVLLHTEVRELVGERILEALVVEDNQTGERSTIPARLLFVFIGARPHTGWLGDETALDERGFVMTGAAVGDDHERPLLATSRPGVFAAGDVRHGSIKRVASAVGEGSMAVRLIHEYLEQQAAQTNVSSK